jgi:2-amino-4-hydroxy-6-hydroxymethyldihydropteridine diphosphokinase
VEQITAYIGVGANLGDKACNCRHALKRIAQLPGCTIISRSPLFKTEPVGVTEQDWYINCVAGIRTNQTPVQLLKNLLTIEAQMGRIRKRRWEARLIDLDLLLFGQVIIRSHDLVVPHPRLHLRQFVLEPLARVAPDLIHPVCGLTIRQLLHRLPKGPSVEELQEDQSICLSAP